MNYQIFDAIALLNEAENIEDLCRIFERVMCRYGFDLFASQFTPNDFMNNDKKPVAHATFNPQWVDYYFDQNYHLIDPVIHTGIKSKRPFFWSDTWKGLELSKQQKKFFNEASDYGVGVGIGIPILSPFHQNGMISLVSTGIKQEEIETIVQENELALQLLSNHFQMKAFYFAQQVDKGTPSIHLSKREVECLKWAAIGKTDREIAMLLNISHRTVNHHMANAMHKLDAYSREYAVVKAIMNHIIQL